MECSVGSAVERPEGSHIVCTNYLVLVPTDPDFIPPTDTHGRAAELLRVWLPDAEDGSCETRDTVEFVDPGGNWEGVACPAYGADARHARVGRGHEPRLSRRRRLCRAACGSGWPLLHVHHVDDAFDLLDVLPFMASQPLRIEQHGPLEYLSRPRHCRRT